MKTNNPDDHLIAFLDNIASWMYFHNAEMR